MSRPAADTISRGDVPDLVMLAATRSKWGDAAAGGGLVRAVPIVSAALHAPDGARVKEWAVQFAALRRSWGPGWSASCGAGVGVTHAGDAAQSFGPGIMDSMNMSRAVEDFLHWHGAVADLIHTVRDERASPTRVRRVVHFLVAHEAGPLGVSAA